MLSRKPSCSFFQRVGFCVNKYDLCFSCFCCSSYLFSRPWTAYMRDAILYLQRVRGLGGWGAENKKKSHKKITKNEETRKKDRCGRWIRTRVGLNHHRKLVKAIMVLCFLCVLLAPLDTSTVALATLLLHFLAFGHCVCPRPEMIPITQRPGHGSSSNSTCGTSSTSSCGCCRCRCWLLLFLGFFLSFFFFSFFLSFFLSLSLCFFLCLFKFCLFVFLVVVFSQHKPPPFLLHRRSRTKQWDDTGTTDSAGTWDSSIWIGFC